MSKRESEDLSDIDEIARRVLALPKKKQAYMVAIIDAMQTDSAGTTTGEADRLIDLLRVMKPLLDD
jgi:hypothetical protein